MNTMSWMWSAWAGMAGFVGVYGWVWQGAGDRGRKWLEWGLTVLLAVVSLASVLTHEPWRDELHNWLVTRELTLSEMWREMRWEGHFLPWHLLLHPFARLGAPVWTMGSVSWGINLATMAWFARKAPLGGWAKAAVGLSCVFLYVNPVIARCYVLVPPILFGLAILWKKRDEQPVMFGMLVALLANTHVCMEGTAGLVFLVFAWENVFKRADGKQWRECGRQWAGLGVMVAGGVVALAQVLPTLWDPSICFGGHFPWKTDATWFFQGCQSWIGLAGMVVGLVWLGGGAWRRDRGLFLVFAGSLAYMVFFSVFVYPAHVVNRALLWWPITLGIAWALEAREDGAGNRGGWLTAAVTVAGLGLMRPDMTWRDWRAEYDTLPGACRFIAERYGGKAEVWINGGDMCTEVASAYLNHLRDWRTGERAVRMRLSANVPQPTSAFRDFLDDYFADHPEEESVLVLGSMSQWCGLTEEDVIQRGVEMEYLAQWAVGPWFVPAMVLKVWRRNLMEPEEFWSWAGMKRGERGDWEGTEDAWKRVVQEDGERWDAMNNLSWMALQAGKVQEARAWMDRAMEKDEAKQSPGVWDTEAAVRRAEGDEDGAREAEQRREKLELAYHASEGESGASGNASVSSYPACGQPSLGDEAQGNARVAGDNR